MTTEERIQQIRICLPVVSPQYRADIEFLLEQLCAQARTIAGPNVSLGTKEKRDKRTDAQCLKPPPGWQCTRKAGHEGPCAAVDVSTLDNPCGDALDRLWKEIILVRRPNYGDWEYPGQAYRHILAEFKEVAAERERMRGTLLELRRDAPTYEGLQPSEYLAFCVRTKQMSDVALAGATKPDVSTETSLESQLAAANERIDTLETAVVLQRGLHEQANERAGSAERERDAAYCAASEMRDECAEFKEALQRANNNCAQSEAARNAALKQVADVGAERDRLATAISKLRAIARKPWKWEKAYTDAGDYKGYSVGLVMTKDLHAVIDATLGDMTVEVAAIAGTPAPAEQPEPCKLCRHVHQGRCEEEAPNPFFTCACPGECSHGKHPAYCKECNDPKAWSKPVPVEPAPATFADGYRACKGDAAKALCPYCRNLAKYGEPVRDEQGWLVHNYGGGGWACQASAIRALPVKEGPDA